MIQTYYGFDYWMTSMFDVVRMVPQAFHSVLAAKKHEVWSVRAKTAKDSPNEFVVTDFSIASNVYGEPFSFGDVMEGNFNMKIIEIKVI